MRMKKFFKGLSLSTIAAISLAACSNTATTSTKPKQQDSKVIKVVQIGTLSGNTASFGTWEDQSFKMAIDEVNKSGGIHGRKIELTKADDQGNPTVAVNLARKMSTGDVSAAFAATLSTSTLAVLNVFDQAKIPQLTGSQDPSITTKGSKYIFRFNASSKAYTKTAANYIVKGLGLKKIAVLSNSGAYGRGEHATFVDALKSLNVTPITEEEVSPDAKDFTAQLMSIKEKNPEVIYIGAKNVQAGLIVKQAKALKIDAKIVGGSPTWFPHLFSDSRSGKCRRDDFYNTVYRRCQC
jgi:branched-chain amino acid transport system substrate-binding protein